MAIYHFHTGIIKHSVGKCAVASAAYMSGSKLYDERLGKTFSYTRKEEVIYSDIMLPENAPKELYDRETLWNEVEKVQNKSNSRYARQFDMALPIELSTKEQIELAKRYVKKNFVDKGMVVDFAIHEKEGNPHMHVMCTVRGFNKNGMWAKMEKKVYARDKNGDKIPEIDPKTGKQKVRVRKGKGEEKLWKRVTVKSNDWNSREQLISWRENWANICNEYLEEKDNITHLSFEAQGIERVPTIHEGYAARGMEDRGELSDRVNENVEIRELNIFFADSELFVNEAMRRVQNIINQLKEEEHDYDKRRRSGAEDNNRRYGRSDQRIRKNSAETSGRKQELQKRDCTSKRKGEQTVRPKVQQKSLKERLLEKRLEANKLNRERSMDKKRTINKRIEIEPDR